MQKVFVLDTHVTCTFFAMERNLGKLHHPLQKCLHINEVLMIFYPLLYKDTSHTSVCGVQEVSPIAVVLFTIDSDTEAKTEFLVCGVSVNLGSVRCDSRYWLPQPIGCIS